MKAPSILVSVLMVLVGMNLYADEGLVPQGGAGVAPAAARPDEPVVPVIKYIVSPWGHGDYYEVVPGPNRLRCQVEDEFFIHIE